MLKNYFKIAFRNLWRPKAFSLINIMGLAVGMTACFLIFLYVSFETNYDNFHSKADRIYRVASDVKTPSETISSGITIAPLAIYLKKDFPEVEDAVRISSDGFLVRKDNVKFQGEMPVMADSTLLNVFDFPLIEGNKNTTLKEPMSIILSQTAAKKCFGKTDHRFCGMMCPNPRLPKQPVYGLNDWNFAYGKNTFELIKTTTAAMAQLVSDTDNKPGQGTILSPVAWRWRVE